MAYRLRPHETVGHGLRRLVDKELSSVRDELKDGAPSDEGIHEARKSVKRFAPSSAWFPPRVVAVCAGR
jgi:hypothetical protein